MAFVKLYLDVDGVVLPFDKNPKLQSVTWLNKNEYYYSDIIKSIGHFGLDIYWLTSRREQEVNQLKDANSILSATTYLQLPTAPNTPRIIQKLFTLLQDQQTPTPFIWADDDITPNLSKILDKKHLMPHLLIKPDKVAGLTANDICAIDNFTKLISTSLP